MYLKDKLNGDLIEILDTGMLFDPCQAEVTGRLHAGEEMQDPAGFPKAGLVFPSGESLPRCWVDPKYRS